MLNKEKLKGMDPNILVGLVNMKLRNQFNTLGSLAAYFDLNVTDLQSKLADGGFEYIPSANQFR